VASRKDEIIEKLRELSELTVLDDANPQSFRARAYEMATTEISLLDGAIEDMTAAQLVKIDGIGKSTANKIREYFDNGKIEKLEKLREKFPPAYVELSRVPGLGPKSLKRLRAELSVENITDLRRAIDSKQIRELKGFGAKTEEKLAKALDRVIATGGADKRTPIARAMPLAMRLVAALEELPQVERAQFCGSLRRHRETIGDIDVVVAASEGASDIMAAFVAMPVTSEVLVRGETKTSVLTDRGLQIDLRVVKPHEFGAATLYFTGSKLHNIKLRQRALDRGWTLNEYALTVVETEEVVASKTEQDIYAALDLQWVPAPMREDSGEIEAAADEALPERVELEHINGDLHVHTSLSGDGRSPLEDIVARAAERGLTYMAITDHGEDLVINGVGRDDLVRQRETMAKLQDTYPELRLLHGCELNIGPDGGLDYDEDFRMGFDWCVAAVHSHFDLDQAKQTKRIIEAMQDPAVNVIGHLSGRMIGKRPGIELDIDAVLQAAADTNPAIEINSALPRLDAASEVLRRARDYEVTLVISTDSHHVDEMIRMQWGALQAQRGWVDRSRVANTWSRDQFLAWARETRGA
jgi:DNA polymerase (family 10)